MKGRPILFSGEMVRAILEGRKTQTRRLVVPRTWDACAYSNAYLRHHEDPRIGLQAYFWNDGMEDRLGVRCPYADGIGDRLWVRETWAVGRVFDKTRPSKIHTTERDIPVWYAADGAEDESWANRGRWRSSIHMPRWASRITLEVTEVRVQRPRDISEEDALAEGVDPYECPSGPATPDAVSAFAELWEKINGKRAPLSSNPWVWAISFKRVAP